MKIASSDSGCCELIESVSNSIADKQSETELHKLAELHKCQKSRLDKEIEVRDRRRAKYENTERYPIWEIVVELDLKSQAYYGESYEATCMYIKDEKDEDKRSEIKWQCPYKGDPKKALIKTIKNNEHGHARVKVKGKGTALLMSMIFKKPECETSFISQAIDGSEYSPSPFYYKCGLIPQMNFPGTEEEKRNKHEKDLMAPLSSVVASGKYLPKSEFSSLSFHIRPSEDSNPLFDFYRRDHEAGEGYDIYIGGARKEPIARVTFETKASRRLLSPFDELVREIKASGVKLRQCP